jgi:hypothetical protein
MGTCMNCKYWYKPDHECTAVETWADWDSTVKDDDFAVAVRYDDDQGLNVQLRTGPNFGCVNFHD